MEKIAPLLVSIAISIIYLLALVYFTVLKDTSLKARKHWANLYYTLFWNLPVRTLMEGYLPLTQNYL
jgi:hypothetical protein